MDIPICPGCHLPAHASESDDEDYHEGCRPCSCEGKPVRLHSRLNCPVRAAQLLWGPTKSFGCFGTLVDSSEPEEED